MCGVMKDTSTVLSIGLFWMSTCVSLLALPEGKGDLKVTSQPTNATVTVTLEQRLRAYERDAYREVVREKRVDLIPLLEELRRGESDGLTVQVALAGLGVKKYRDEIVQELINPTNTVAYAYFLKTGFSDPTAAKLQTISGACSKLARLRDKSLVKYLIATLDYRDVRIAPNQRLGAAPFQSAGFALWSMHLEDAPPNSPLRINEAYMSAWKGWWEKHKEEYEKGGVLPPLPPPRPEPSPAPEPVLTLEHKLRQFDIGAYEEVATNKRTDMIPLLEELAQRSSKYKYISGPALARLGVKKYRDEIVEELINPTNTTTYAELLGICHGDSAKAEWRTIKGASIKIATIGDKSTVKYLITMLDYQGDMMKRVNMPINGNTPQDMAITALRHMNLKDAPTIYPSDIRQREVVFEWKKWWEKHKDEYEKLETTLPVPSPNQTQP